MLWFPPRGRTRNVIFLPYKKNLSPGLRQDPSFPKSDPAKPYPSVPVSSSLLSRNPPKNEVLPYKLIPSLKDTKSFTKKPLFPERLFEWEFWWVEGNRATAGKYKKVVLHAFLWDKNNNI